MEANSMTLVNLAVSSLFIFALRGLTFPHTAHRSNLLGILGMCLALTLSLIYSPQRFTVLLVIVIGTLIGIFIAQHIQMTQLPQTIAAFNGFGGLSAFLTAVCAVLEDKIDPFDTPIDSALGIFTFTGSLIAFLKLQGLVKDNFSFLTQRLNLAIFTVMLLALLDYSHLPNNNEFYILSAFAGLLGITLTLKIGGADMPIIIALLNAASGLDSAAIGFVLGNPLLIITGALIGVSGSILAYIMCKAMNRKLLQVLFSSKIEKLSYSPHPHQEVRTGSPSEAAFIMENSRKIIIVPGYGMAVAQAQHTLQQLAEILHQKYSVDVKFAIHPVAGRMPGHMNVLLAEANVPYENIYGLTDINSEFSSTDVAYIIGANDIVNPLAKTDPNSAIYGMPILEAGLAKTVFIVKRSLATGYSGIDNPLFYADNTIMLFGDAQKVTQEIIKNLEHQQ